MKDAERLVDEGIFDYVELLIDPKNPGITPFCQFDVEYVVHTPHENYGVDIGHPEQRDFTLKMIDYSLRCAEDLDAKTVILHAGTDSMENAKKILSDLDDLRIVIENMPKVGINGEACLGYNSESMTSLTNGRFKICLDFGHAVKASIALKNDYRAVISDFMEMEPRLFHLSDGDLKSVKDNHLNLDEGAFDLKYFKSCVRKSRFKEITLETPRQNPKSLEEDLRNIEILSKI